MYFVFKDSSLSQEETHDGSTGSQSDSAIIFPYDTTTNTFQKAFYHPAHTDGRASYEDIHQVLVKVEVRVHPKLKKADVILASYLVFIFVTLGLLLSFIFFSESKDF